MVGEVAVRHGPDRLAHQAARAVAADDVLGADHPLGAARHVLQGDDDRMVALGLDLEGHELLAVVGLEPRRRLAHVVEQIAQQAGLVDDEVRELRQAVLGVLDATGAHDRRLVFRRGTPEHGLVDPVALADELLSQTEGLEHLDRAARHAVRLADLQRAVSALDEAGGDARERRELRGQHHAGGTAADDENVDRVGKIRWPCLGAGCGGENVRITGRVTVEIELHVVPPLHGAGMMSTPSLSVLKGTCERAGGMRFRLTRSRSSLAEFDVVRFNHWTPALQFGFKQ